MKKVLALILALVMLFASFSNVMAFADGSAENAPLPSGTLGNGVVELTDPFVGNRSISGYASQFVSQSGQGSFNVYVTGSLVWEGGITFKTSCDESNSAAAVISIQRPNGAYVFQNVAFHANEERYYGYYLATPGTYTVYYDNYIPAGATMHMQIWIY